MTFLAMVMTALLCMEAKDVRNIPPTRRLARKLSGAGDGADFIRGYAPGPAQELGTLAAEMLHDQSWAAAHTLIDTAEALMGSGQDAPAECWGIRFRFRGRLPQALELQSRAFALHFEWRRFFHAHALVDGQEREYVEAQKPADPMAMCLADLLADKPRIASMLEEHLGVVTVEDLLHCDQSRILSIRNFGAGMMAELFRALKTIGLEPASRASVPRRRRKAA